MERCWLARFSDRPCEGRMQKAHLVPKALIKREVFGGSRFTSRRRRRRYEGGIVESVVWDGRVWVPACSGHHHALDFSRKLRIPRESLPERLESFCEEYGLVWWLEREYGSLGEAPAPCQPVP